MIPASVYYERERERERVIENGFVRIVHIFFYKWRQETEKVYLVTYLGTCAWQRVQHLYVGTRSRDDYLDKEREEREREYILMNQRQNEIKLRTE